MFCNFGAFPMQNTDSFCQVRLKETGSSVARRAILLRLDARQQKIRSKIKLLIYFSSCRYGYRFISHSSTADLRERPGACAAPSSPAPGANGPWTRRNRARFLCRERVSVPGAAPLYLSLPSSPVIAKRRSRNRVQGPLDPGAGEEGAAQAPGRSRRSAVEE